MRPLHFYLFGTATWFLGYGIQGVMFAWLVTMVLHETPEKVGLAQMTLLLPGTLLILIGGSYADRFGGRRVAALAQTGAGVAIVFLLWVLVSDHLTYTMMIVYALIMGCAQAFVTPARDGLLSQVAEGRVQRTVMLTSIMQFGLQMVGFLVASLADFSGPVIILCAQGLVLLVGVWSFLQIRGVDQATVGVAPRLWHSVKEGARTVFSSAPMRTVMIQNMAMAMFFMGSYIVTLPLMVRESFAGSAADLAYMNGANSLGLVLTILLLLRLGDIRRQGRALLLAQGTGALVFASAALAPGFEWFVFAIFVWGICGGLAMTMSRTIMQELAPGAQRGRVMSFYAFSFMGAGPIGALLCGYLVEIFGPRIALVTAATAMLSVIVAIGLISQIWRLQGHVHETLDGASKLKPASR
jgi:MFS family permease